MVQGAIRCPTGASASLSRAVRELKAKHNAAGELKWTKVSHSRSSFYMDLVEWFFNTEEAEFRALVVTHKDRLNHSAFNEGSHDSFYYKMYFSLLSKILSPDCIYNIYLDVKDTRSRLKLRKLREVLCNNVHDFTSQMVSHIQNIYSSEADLMQVSDFLTGAVSYRNRGLSSNQTKKEVVDRIERHLQRKISISSPLSHQKFNIFVFTPQSTPT
jgi:hypothetical protein